MAHTLSLSYRHRNMLHLWPKLIILKFKIINDKPVEIFNLRVFQSIP